MGDEAFWAAARDLHVLAKALWDRGRTDGCHAGIEEVRTACPDHLSVVEKHWSGRLNAPENRGFAEGADQP